MPQLYHFSLAFCLVASLTPQCRTLEKAQHSQCANRGVQKRGTLGQPLTKGRGEPWINATLSIPSEAHSAAVKLDNIILCWLSFLLFLSAVPSPVPGISALNKPPERQPLPRALLSWGPQAKSHVNTNNDVARTRELRGRAPKSPP